MANDFSTWWEEVKEDLSGYLQARGKLTKIQAYEKIAKITGVMVSFIILAFIVVFVIIFVLIMVGSWIYDLTGSAAIGFSSVALLVVGLFVFLLLKRKTMLEIPVSRGVITALYEEEDFLEDKNQSDSDGEKI